MKLTKTLIQKQALELSEKHKALALLYATGVGKTLAALNIIENNNGRWYIILAEKAHKTNWMEDIVKHKKEHLLPRITFFLYASIHKFSDPSIKVTGIVLDETHHCLSENRLEHLSKINTQKYILLSATLKNEEIEKLTKITGKIYIDQIPLTAAIENGILPAPIIKLMPIQLDSEKRSEVFIIRAGLEKLRSKFECNWGEHYGVLDKLKNVEITVHCTQLQKYNWFEEQMDYWKQQFFSTRTDWSKKKWLLFGSQRKAFMASIKTLYANELILKLNREGKRTIIFTGSIKQCNTLGGKDNVVHSKIKENQYIINSFNTKKINQLFAVGMLKEGVNLTDIEVGVIVQLDGNTRSYLQRQGRILRAEDNPEQYIFYIERTRDKEFLDNAIKGLEKYIKI